MIKRFRRQEGITLMEVMVSMVILSLGILGMVPLIGLTIYNNTFSSDMTNYNALAQQAVEQLLLINNYGTLPYSKTESPPSGDYTIYKRVVDNSADGSVPVGVYKITVDIQWTDQQAMNRSVSYVTLKPMI